jgi:hypothetical protein
MIWWITVGARVIGTNQQHIHLISCPIPNPTFIFPVSWGPML